MEGGNKNDNKNSVRGSTEGAGGGGVEGPDWGKESDF